MNELEKYLARAAGKDNVTTGEDIKLDVDLVIAHDVTGPMAIEQFLKIGTDSVFDKNKVVFVLDHIIPAGTVNARKFHNIITNFGKGFGTKVYNKSEGVIHQVIAENHRLNRGEILIGADSHTGTAGAYGAIAIPVGATELAAAMATGTVDIEVPEVYVICIDGDLNPGVSGKDIILHLIGRFGTDGFTDKAVIFTGERLRNLSLEDRMTISNMGIEMGAMISYFAENDDVSDVKVVYKIAAEDIPVSIACPYSPGNVKSIDEVVGTKLTQVVVGSCTNGRISDMRILAEVLKDKAVHDDITLLAVPASKTVLDLMEEEGLTKIIRNAGGIVTSPGCGPCFGAHMGLLAKEDVALSTTNRNFHGRMGAQEAQVYLGSPRVAAESAVTGVITKPGTVLPLTEVQ